MRRTLIAAAVGVAMLVAGCGSSSKTTPTTPATTSSGSTSGSTTSAPTSTTAMTTTGSAGTMGPPSSGKYNATNQTVLTHINAALVKFFTAKGFSGVTANCTGVNPATASCKVTGTNSQGQTSSAVLTISVNQTTGQLHVSHVSQ